MNTPKTHSFRFPVILLTVLLALSACAPAQPPPAGTPVVITREVTRLVSQDVTQQVTKIVEVPVTVTPGPAAAPTNTLEPNATPPGNLPQATLSKSIDCNYGPADWFLYKTSFPAGAQVEVVGRSESGEGLAIEEAGGWDYCWVAADVAELAGISGFDVESLPVAKLVLPRSEYEYGSPYASAKRNGDEVTVSWEAVYMSRDEIHGYVLDLALCRAGQLTESWIFLYVTYDENVGIQKATFIDEAGCSEPSKAHIITYGRRGFAEWEKIFWPPY